jgi:hypothetical protein
MSELTGPYRSLDEVVTRLGTLERRFRQAGDRRAIFLTLYGLVSSAMREQVRRQAFEDNAWVERYAVAFADLYRVALERYESTQTSLVPTAWRICFDAAKAGNGLVLQDLLLGVNAHVNHDLPLALLRVSIDPDRMSRYRDHTAVNRVLASVTEPATRRLAELYAPGLETADEVAGQLDEILSAFSLEVARESAWETAVALANARSDQELALTSRLSAARAAVMARLLRAPSRHPSFVAACRRLEAQSDWLALMDNAIHAA